MLGFVFGDELSFDASPPGPVSALGGTLQLKRCRRRQDLKTGPSLAAASPSSTDQSPLESHTQSPAPYPLGDLYLDSAVVGERERASLSESSAGLQRSISAPMAVVSDSSPHVNSK
jgi:hypothetical protein